LARLPAEVLDRRTLLELRELSRRAGTELLSELVATFLREAPAALARMRGALTEGDLVEFEADAHSLKGTSGHLGVARVEAVCSEIVERSRGSIPVELDQLLEQLAEEIESARRQLCQELDLPLRGND
jgi:HPt (histidine-containing phosphotransfer) domain-containing protein